MGIWAANWLGITGMNIRSSDLAGMLASAGEGMHRKGYS